MNPEFQEIVQEIPEPARPSRSESYTVMLFLAAHLS
jgi:hypothetical protein